MRARSPHQSGPYGDHLQYSTGSGPTTPEPRLHTHTHTKPSVASKLESHCVLTFDSPAADQ